MRPILASLLLSASLLVASARSGVASQEASENSYEWTGVRRIVAVGDVHGAYENLARVLRNAGLIDEKNRWVGGDTHLVQNGDVVDRGPHSRKAMDLLIDLQDDAEKAGGAIHALIGNHEAMNVVGILDLVSESEYEAFVDRDSRQLRETTFERYYEQLRQQARQNDQEPPDKGATRREFEEKYPLGYVEHRRAFSEHGKYGKWIRSNPVAIKINGIVFSHGDWSEKFAAMGLAEVNRRIRAELSGELPLEGGITFDPESPIQYRGLSHTPLTQSSQQAEEERVSRILSMLGATRMVVGHTLTSGVIESRFGGKHIGIDTGMLELYHGGHRVALEIEDGVLRAIHDGGKIPVPLEMNENAFIEYVRAVARVDPENVDVQLKLVDSLHQERRTEEAAAILEHLLEKPELVPFRYRDLLGSYYEARGDSARAREHYLAYIEGLAKLVEASPDNLNLANLLARFCIEKGLELDRAERVIAAAVERSPGSSSYLLTQARLYIARSRFREALSILDGLPRDPGIGYDIHYLTGLAYVGLNDLTRAREAFEQATALEPDRQEAREELKKLETTPLLR